MQEKDKYDHSIILYSVNVFSKGGSISAGCFQLLCESFNSMFHQGLFKLGLKAKSFTLSLDLAQLTLSYWNQSVSLSSTVKTTFHVIQYAT